MESKNGSIQISTENMFPIIKKWLYSEKDIFIREIVSNGNDAINKLKKLVAVGEAEIPEGTDDYKIEVTLDKDAGTITVHDNGIGMTEEEVLKYINQVAFSGAKDFLEKYQGKTDDAQIIGHFGLGFYSAFMVSDKVEIDTLSYQEGAEAVHWESDSGMEYKIEPSDLDERGTYVTMHISDDSKEYLEKFKLKEILLKYFNFLPIELYFRDLEDNKAEETKEGEADEEPKEEKKPEPINNTTPLWLKPVSECKDEDYIKFYHEVFFDMADPLFWIHLNIDYPFNLKGILYFPKMKDKYDSLEGTIKVYYNQVFVADNVKEILPEFLLLLKGMIDCPDLPLNVSRSFLQNDGYVKKISQHITKKIGDKLCGLFKTERENYCKYWDDINPFIKYGCLKDEKFYDKIKDVILFKEAGGEYVTVDEYLDKNKEKSKDKIYYTDSPAQQAQYVKLMRDAGIEPIVMDHPIDTPFMQFLEYKNTGKFKFDRVDAEVSDSAKNDESDKEANEKIAADLAPAFQKYAGNEKLKVQAETLKSDVPAMLLLSEQSRRIKEMARMYGDGFSLPTDDDITLILNTNNSLVKNLDKITDESDKELAVSQIYDLAKLAHEPMTAEEIIAFIERSGKILDKAFKENTDAES